MSEELTAHFEEHGYAILPGLLSAGQIAEAHELRDRVLADWQYANNTKVVADAVGDLVERAPRFTLPILLDSRLVAFAEAIMGPRLQLDSVVLNADPAADESDRLGVVQWHRDRFGYLPPDGKYVAPMSVVVLCYLQDMDDDAGPLRVIPGSHRNPITLTPEEQTEPHDQELLVHTEAGDAVVIHHNLLHSGTKAVRPGERRFMGWIYNLSSLIHEDTFAGPNCRQLVADARKRNDRRLLRLLGEDPLIVPRQNSGFVSDERAEWREWLEEDERLAEPRSYTDVGA